MSETFRGMTPLDWQSLVGEALRRRKEEGLTQKEHAALANVSIPTIAAFDRGETTLTLAKAFDILRVVGLLSEPDEAGAQAAFVREAFARWQELTADLPEDSPGRFPHGWYRFDYWLEGEVRSESMSEFQDIRREVAATKYSGWPVFLTLTRHELAPYEHAGAIECWLSPESESVNRSFGDPAHCDFWRATPSYRLFLMRGYQEDGQETFPPGTIFDTTLPVWRMGEALLHAERLAALIREGSSDLTIHFRAVYSGLSGRVLRSWANPLSDLLLEGHAARGDEAVLEAIIPAGDVESRLVEHLFPLVSSLYERFGITGLSPKRVEAEVDRFLSNKNR